MRVAISTITVLRHPYGHADIISYQEMIGPVFMQAHESPGFITRAMPVDDRTNKTNFERDWGPWGEFTTPRYYTGGRVTGTDSRASTLSLWTDLESLFDFAYSEKHRYMVRNRERWVDPFDWKPYAIWWIGDEDIPTWGDGCQRIEHLNDHGPSPHAFDFGHPYDADGNPTKVRRSGRARTEARGGAH